MAKTVSRQWHPRAHVHEYRDHNGQIVQFDGTWTQVVIHVERFSETGVARDPILAIFARRASDGHVRLIAREDVRKCDGADERDRFYMRREEFDTARTLALAEFDRVTRLRRNTSWPAGLELPPAGMAPPARPTESAPRPSPVVHVRRGGRRHFGLTDTPLGKPRVENGADGLPSTVTFYLRGRRQLAISFDINSGHPYITGTAAMPELGVDEPSDAWSVSSATRDHAFTVAMAIRRSARERRRRRDVAPTVVYRTRRRRVIHWAETPLGRFADGKPLPPKLDW